MKTKSSALPTLYYKNYENLMNNKNKGIHRVDCEKLCKNLRP